MTMAHLFRVLTDKLLPPSTSCHDIIIDHVLKHVLLVDFRESARGGAGVQQPGQRVPLSTGLRQGRVLPHAGAGAGAGDGRQSHRDEGVRWSGARRPVHAGRCGRGKRIRRPVKACDKNVPAALRSPGPGAGAPAPPAPAGNRSGAAGQSGAGPRLLQPGWVRLEKEVAKY